MTGHLFITGLPDSSIYKGYISNTTLRLQLLQIRTVRGKCKDQ